MKKAVFLDRDGTLIEDNGYISLIDDVDFFDDTFSSLLLLQQEYDLFVISNQSGIAKGLITHDDVKRLNGYIDNVLKDKENH